MKKYNGHRSWNAWNVSLWINNNYGLYQSCVDILRSLQKKYPALSIEQIEEKAASILAKDFAGVRTPDGAKYNRLAIREAIREMIT